MPTNDVKFAQLLKAVSEGKTVNGTEIDKEEQLDELVEAVGALEPVEVEALLQQTGNDVSRINAMAKALTEVIQPGAKSTNPTYVAMPRKLGFSLATEVFHAARNCKVSAVIEKFFGGTAGKPASPVAWYRMPRNGHVVFLASDGRVVPIDVSKPDSLFEVLENRSAPPPMAMVAARLKELRRHKAND